MKIANRFKLLLKSILSLQFGEVSTDKSVLYWDGTEDLKEGDEVYVKGENDEFVPAPDGDYITEDGKTITVVEGKVAEIKDAEAEVAPEEPANEEPVAEVKAEIEEPAAEPVDEQEKPEEEEKTVEDRIAALEDKLNALVEGINAIVNSIAALEERMVEVEGKLAKVEAPAADPIDETPVEEEKKTRLSYIHRKK